MNPIPTPKWHFSHSFTEIEPGEVTDDESDNEDKVSQEKLSLLGTES